MRFIIGTHARLFFAEIDDSWRVSHLQTLATGHHYGIGLLRGDGQRFVSKHNDRELTYYQYGPESKVESVRPLGGQGHYIHQIACAETGIYLANTGFNSITFQSYDGAIWEEHFVNEQRTDVNHVNSVFPCGERLLVLLHNLGTRPSEVLVMRHAPGRGFVLEGAMPVAHRGCHNVYYDGDRLHYNASAAGKFLTAAPKQNRIVHELTLPGHTKGLSVTERHLIVGFSDHASREQRAASRGYLAVLDRADLSVRATVDLNVDGPTGNVNEVRCLSEPELGQAGPAGLLDQLPAFSLPESQVAQRSLWRRLVAAASSRWRDNTQPS